MEDFNNVDLFVWVKTKYQNKVFKNLHYYIFVYLLNYPNKIELYLDKNLDVVDLIQSLSYEPNKENNLLAQVIEYVETY